MRDSLTVYRKVFKVLLSSNPNSNKYWYHFASSLKEPRTSTLARIEECRLKIGLKELFDR